MRTCWRFTKVMRTSRRLTNARDSWKSCVRARDSQNLQESCVRAEDSQKTGVPAEDSHSSQNPCASSKRDDAIVQPVVEDPVDDDRIPVEAGAEPITTPCEPSELENMKHELSHIPFKPCCTSCVKGTAQAEPHERNRACHRRQRTSHCSV